MAVDGVSDWHRVRHELQSLILLCSSDGDSERLDVEEFTELLVRLGAYHAKK